MCFHGHLSSIWNSLKPGLQHLYFILRLTWVCSCQSRHELQHRRALLSEWHHPGHAIRDQPRRDCPIKISHTNVSTTKGKSWKNLSSALKMDHKSAQLNWQRYKTLQQRIGCVRACHHLLRSTCQTKRKADTTADFSYFCKNTFALLLAMKDH